MNAKNKKQFGIWMDSHHATVVGRKSINTGDFVILYHGKNDESEANSNEKAENNREKMLLHKFFKNITAHMQNADEVHVTGTGTAQEQFIHYMADTPQFKNVITKESTSNKMNDGKLIEYMEEQFN